MKLRHALSTLLLACGLTTAAHATVVTLDNPDAAIGFGGEQTTPAAPLGEGAWSSTTMTGDDTYSLQYLYWDTDTTTTEYYLGDLLSLSYQTLKASGENDFFIQIYTTIDLNNDGAGWYGQRLTFDPLYANNKNAPNDIWNTWSTSGSENQLTVYDHQNFGGYDAPTLAELLDDTYTDNELYTFGNVDYAAEAILAISIKTGSGWAKNFAGSIDNVVLDFGEKGLMQFDLEPASVPEPSTFAVFALAFAGLVARRFKRS